MKERLFRKYINLKMKAVKINSNKVPLTNWKEAECAEYEENALYAFVIPEGILVIDVDVKNNQPGLESFERFKRDTNTEIITHNVTTGSGGYHYYCYYPQDLPLLDPYACKQVYPGIDFLHEGKLVIGAEQLLNNGEYKLNPTRGLEFNGKIDYRSNPFLVYKGDFAFHKRYKDTIRNDLKNFTSSLDYSNISLEQIKACLDLVDSSDYFLWIKVGMALYQQLGDFGFPLFVEWSKKSDKFKSEYEAMTKWKSFNQKDPSIENAVTFGTLHYHALETKFNNLALEIKQCKDKDSVKKVLKNEKYTSYPKFKNEHILNIIPNYLKKLEPFYDYKISQLKDLCKDSLKTDQDVSHETSRKEELNELIFNKYIRLIPVLNKNCYVDINNGDYVDKKSLETEIKPYKQELQELYNVKDFTVDTADSEKLIKEARLIDYNPSVKDKFYINSQGSGTYNLYDYKTVPPLIETMTTEGERFKKALLDAEVLLGKQILDILLNINRYFIDHPGERLRWILVIYGAPGLGKTLLLETLLSISVGKGNYKPLQNSNLQSEYNGWMRKAQVRVIAELKMDRETYNNFKPALTDERIQISEKYEVNSTIENKVNFIATTNYKDCVPLESDDRRFALVFSKVDNTAELNTALQARGYKDSEEYFNILGELIKSPKEVRGQLRYFISQYPYSPYFSPNKILFENDKKIVMQASLKNNSNNEFILNIIESIYNEQFPTYIDFNLINEEYTKRFCNQSEYGLINKLSPYKIKKIITSFGYVEYKTWFYFKTCESDKAKHYIQSQKKLMQSTTPSYVKEKIKQELLKEMFEK